MKKLFMLPELGGQGGRGGNSANAQDQTSICATHCHTHCARTRLNYTEHVHYWQICDQGEHCCLTADNLHSQYGNDRERGSLDIYADKELLGDCYGVRLHNSFK